MMRSIAEIDRDHEGMNEACVRRSHGCTYPACECDRKKREIPNVRGVGGPKLVKPTRGVPVVPADRVERLRDAIEGECDGLAVDEQHARAILQYVDGVTASQAQNSAPHEVYILDCGTDDRPSWCAVKDSPGPHGFMRPDAPKRMAVRYVRADLAGVKESSRVNAACGVHGPIPCEGAGCICTGVTGTGILPRLPGESDDSFLSRIAADGGKTE